MNSRFFISPSRQLLVSSAVVGLLLSLTASVQALTFTPTIFTDPPVSGAGVSVNTANGVITGGAGNGQISLRSATLGANANPGSTIALGTGTYQLTIAGDANDRNWTGTPAQAFNPHIGDLDIYGSGTTIDGAGPSLTTIHQMTGADRFLVDNPTSAVGFTFTLKDVTVRGGRDTSNSKGGGAMFIGGKDNTSTITNCVFLDNKVTAPASLGGGALIVTGGNLIIAGCTFGGVGVNDPNTCTTSGGALAYEGSDFVNPAGTSTMTMTNCTFINNVANSISAGGGAITISNSNLSTAIANITGCTFTGNQAPGASGGAIVVQTGIVNIASSSFNNNSALAAGGAIHVGGGGTDGLGTTLDGSSGNVTFTGNTAPDGSSVSVNGGPLNVSGTGVSIGGSVYVATNGTWNNLTGSTLAPTDIEVAGGIFNCNNSTMNVAGNITITHEGTKGGIFNADTGTVNIAGNLNVDFANGGSGALGQFNAGTGLFNFNGSGAQAINGPGSPTFNNLTVNKGSNSTLTLNVSSPVAGNLIVTAGVFNLQGNTVNRTAAGGSLTVANGTTLRIGGTNPLPTNYNTHSIGATSTIEYSGSNQTVSTLNSSQVYANLTISGSGIKTLQGATTVATKVTINGGTLDVSASNFALTVSGDFTNNVAAANFNPRSGTVIFNGPAAQNINGTSTSHTFFGLTSNRTGTGNLTLASNVSVNGLLTLTSGNIATGANTLSIGPTGTRSRTSGYILGNEKKSYAGAGTFIFDVGTANGYTRVDSSITAGTGDLTVLAVQGAQPSVVSSRSLQRYWTLTEAGAGITANLVFRYLDPPDVMGNEANYQVLQVTGGARTYFTNNSPAPFVDGVANTLAINGLTSFSDFTAGEARADLQITSVTDAPDPVIVGNNITYTINLVNNGPDTSSNATVTDGVPANTTFVSVSAPAGWTRSDVVPVGGTGNIVFTKTSVASAETAALQVVVKVNANAVGGSTITNSAVTASVITTDPTPGNNTGIAMTLVHTPPALTSANNTTFTVGSAGTFTVTKTGFPAPTLSESGALPSGVTFTPATGVLSGTPAAGTGGTYPITFTASNGVAPDATQSFTFTVNEPPAITSANSTTFTVGSAGSFNVTASGFPSANITMTGGSLPGGVTFTPGAGTATLSGTPNAGTAGSYPLQFTASNGVGSNAIQSFALRVEGTPVVSNISPSVNEDNTLTFSAAIFDAGFSDPNAGDTLQTVRITSLPANGLLKLSDSIFPVPQDIARANLGNLTFTPNADYNGPASFGWNGSDGTLFATSGALVNITVTAVNDNPVAGADIVERYPTSSVKIPVSVLLANDTDPELGTLSIPSVTSPTANGGTVTRTGSYVLYQPAAGFLGADTFTYTLSDGTGGTSLGTVSVNLKVDNTQSKNISRIVPEGANSMRIFFFGIPGRTYTIQFTENLGMPNWQPLSTGTADAQGAFNYLDTPPPAAPSRFYRAVFP